MQKQANDSTISALDYVNEHEFVVAFIAGVGCPSGETIALFGETELPFDLADVLGIVTDGRFDATTDATMGKGRPWSFHDERGNTIYKIQLWSSRKVWLQQYEDYMSEA